MERSLRAYISNRCSLLKDLGVPNNLITEARRKMETCTNEIQVDNIVKKYRLAY